MSISAILPAFNEERNLPDTLKSLREISDIKEIIVVDDGSQDDTNRLARELADHVIALPGNCGKGEAMKQGYLAAKGEIVVFLDSDLGQTASLAHLLIQPVQQGVADMSIAIFPPAQKKSGFGLVKGLARTGIKKLTGFQPVSPLSGQRAMTREAADAVQHWNVRFGIEVGMTIDVLRAGLRVVETPISFSHRETGRDLAGFIHRGRQMVDVGRMLKKKWPTP